MGEQKSSGNFLAVIGLFWIAMGILLIFTFAMSMMGKQLPDFLQFKSESYNLLVLGIVNIVSALGLLYRVTKMWSITIIFMIVIVIGSFMDLFFTSTLKWVLAVAYLVVLIYLMMWPSRAWYKVE